MDTTSTPEPKKTRRTPNFGPCVDCGKDSRDRIMVDENLVPVCRRCHMVRDGRLDKLKSVAATNSQAAKRPPKPCSVCGRPSKPLRKGRCGACYEHLSRHHVERDLVQMTTCPKCGKYKDKRASRCSECRWEETKDEFKTHKTCRKCKKVYPIEHFAWRPAGPNKQKRRSRCKSCECDYAKSRLSDPIFRAHNKLNKQVYNKNNPEKVKRWALRVQWKRNGFDPDEIELLYKNKPKICPICLKKTKLVLDHCHKTNQLRGFICGHCNLVIGKFKDDPDRFIRAAEYLKHYRSIGPECLKKAQAGE